MKPKNKPSSLAVAPAPGLLVRASRSLAQSTRNMLGAKPVELPRIDTALPRLSAVERAAEVLRYTVTSAEYWLSPGGTLRALLRVSLKVALFIGIPTLIIGPTVLLLLEGAAAASASLAAIAANLAALSFSLIAAVIGFAVLTALIRTLSRPK